MHSIEKQKEKLKYNYDFEQIKNPSKDDLLKEMRPFNEFKLPILRQ
jgi:hypothetical protein